MAERSAREELLMDAVAKDRQQRVLQRKTRKLNKSSKDKLGKKKQPTSTSNSPLVNLLRKYFDIWLKKTQERKEHQKANQTDHHSQFYGKKKSGKPDPPLQALIDVESVVKREYEYMCNYK
jgi:hypothetical protein